MGRAIALQFARAGAKVTVADFREETGQETVQLITEAGGEAIFVATDVSSVTAVRNMVRQTTERFGPLHYAVNNAGIIHEFVLLAEVSEEAYDRVMGVNAKGVYFGMSAEIPAILASGGGAIVNISPVDGHTAQALLSAYIASKHAVHGMTKAAAVDYGASPIRINAM
jgi:NAD(P)-dependent dehydrogenase (short-subunit alcohol dehydrogenase family)